MAEPPHGCLFIPTCKGGHINLSDMQLPDDSLLQMHMSRGVEKACKGFMPALWDTTGPRTVQAISIFA